MSLMALPCIPNKISMQYFVLLRHTRKEMRHACRYTSKCHQRTGTSLMTGIDLESNGNGSRSSF